MWQYISGIIWRDGKSVTGQNKKWIGNFIYLRKPIITNLLCADVTVTASDPGDMFDDFTPW